MIGGVRFVNDSKATNVEAAKRSIESFDRGVVAIVGGRFKGGDFRELREPMSTRGRAVMAIGEAAPLVREALGGYGAHHRGGVDARSRRARARGGAAGWRRAARAGVLELRLVPRLRGARARCSREVVKLALSKEKACEGVSGEQSSVGLVRVGAYRWERRLPLSARLVSHSTSRLMTADRFTRRDRLGGFGETKARDRDPATSHQGPFSGVPADIALRDAL